MTEDFEPGGLCDRCGALAYSKATRGAAELFFCAHHTMEHGERLFDTGWTIVSNVELYDNIGAPVPVFA